LTVFNFERLEESIAALATPPGISALAVIRISGVHCLDLCRSILKPSASLSWSPAQVGLCRIFDNDGIELDKVLAVFYKSPYSFTGENSLEIFCHGSPYIYQKILKTLDQIGIKPAEPGEFTRRAFLNGKLDLTEAEGIHALVSSTSETQWYAAKSMIEGSLKDTIFDLRDNLVQAIAYLEAQIDFPEEDDVTLIHSKEIQQILSRVQSRITELIQSYDQGRVASQGIRIAFIGSPNVGKSTLLNTLLGYQRALVSSFSGTTRDYLEEPCLIDGFLYQLVDTAGIHNTDQILENEGIKKSLSFIQSADITLFLSSADSGDKEAEKIYELQRRHAPRKFIFVLTKHDLGVPKWADDRWVKISCHQEKNLSVLKQVLKQKTENLLESFQNRESFITTLRQKKSLEKALCNLKRLTALSQEQSTYTECFAFELQEAKHALEAIVGVVQHEEILDKIFHKFCIGK